MARRAKTKKSNSGSSRRKTAEQTRFDEVVKAQAAKKRAAKAKAARQKAAKTRAAKKQAAAESATRAQATQPMAKPIQATSRFWIDAGGATIETDGLTLAISVDRDVTKNTWMRFHLPENLQGLGSGGEQEVPAPPKVDPTREARLAGWQKATGKSGMVDENPPPFEDFDYEDHRPEIEKQVYRAGIGWTPYVPDMPPPGPFGWHSIIATRVCEHGNPVVFGQMDPVPGMFIRRAWGYPHNLTNMPYSP